MIHFLLRRNSPLVPVLIHAIPPGFFAFCLFEMCFVAILPRKPLNRYVSFRFSDRNFARIFVLSYPCYVPSFDEVISILWNLEVTKRYCVLFCIVSLRSSGPHIFMLNILLYLYFLHTSTSVIVVRQDFLWPNGFFDSSFINICAYVEVVPKLFTNFMCMATASVV